jgi:hypothetical protein
MRFSDCTPFSGSKAWGKAFELNDKLFSGVPGQHGTILADENLDT